MSTQIGRVRGARRAGFVLAACIVLAVLAFLLPRALAPGEVDLVRAEAPQTTSLPELVLAEAPRIAEPSLPTEARTPVADASPTIQGKSAAVLTASSKTPSGRLHVRAVDAATSVALDRIRVRVLSKTRFADRGSGRGAFEVGLTLTPGTYALAVLVPGYEPVELPSVRVPDGERVELATVELHAGSARILGSVGRSVNSEETLHAELIGEGRRPCASCAARFDATRGSDDGHVAGIDRDTPCPLCGFAEQLSRLPVGVGGDFAFQGLTSGPYALRVVDGRGRDVSEPTTVHLREAEIARVELDAPLLRDVRVEVIDTDGTSLAPEWSAIASEDDLAFDVVEGVSDLHWTCEIQANQRRFASEGFSTPTRAAYATGRSGTFGGRRLGSGSRRPSVDDRAIREGDLLLPVPSVPEFATRPIHVRIDADGLVVFEGLPDREMTVVLRCTGFNSSALVPATSRVVSVPARLELAGNVDGGAATFRALDAARYR